MQQPGETMHLNRTRYSIFTGIFLATVSLAVILVPIWRAEQIPALSSPNVTVNVPLNGKTSVTDMLLTTNFYSATEVPVGTTPPLGQKVGFLQQWSPSMVRLHMGFTDTPSSLPESTQGVWDFSSLDAAISTLRANQISFYLNVRNAPPWMFDNQGQLRDPSFYEFSQYMVDLVNWYNKGGFTDENGIYHHSGHIGWVHAWEIWNEPNSGYEIPNVSNPSATWMDPVTFAQLYSIASNAMHAVDPTIITGGPAISADPNDIYLQFFIADVTAPLDFLSFHFYAIGNQKTPDPAAFSEITGNFQHRLIYVRSVLDQTFPGKQVPIWVDEVGYNEIARLPVDPRGTAPVGCAWLAATFAMAEYQHVSLFAQFPFLGNAQLGLIDIKSLQPYVPYWMYQLFASKFPSGTNLIPISIPGSSGIVGLAAVAPDRQSLRLVLANTVVANAKDVNGKGVSRVVRVNLIGVFDTRSAHVGTTATVWRFNAATNRAAMPAPKSLTVFAGTTGTATVQDTLAGYGVDVIEIPLAAQ